MKKITIAAIKFFLVLLLLYVVWNFRLVSYGISQLTGQLKIVFNAVPVEEALIDPGVTDEEKKKLFLINDIRRFATDSIGLKLSDNYSTFYNQRGKPVMWVVTGSLPYSLQPKLWDFPFLGHVSYKGFFKEEKADAEADKIRREGYISDIYSPSAWSTLGFFTDPVLSNFLKRGHGQIAELIIHELTHETIYLKSSVDFNENFATFIGENGAALFLASKFGDESPELKNYLLFLNDEETYGNYMLTSAKQLDSLYKTFTPSQPVSEKALIKYRKIASIMLGVEKLPLNFPKRYRHDFKNKPLPDNPDFMSFLRYRKKQRDFKRVFENQYNSNLKAFITDIIKRSKNREPMPFPMD